MKLALIFNGNVNYQSGKFNHVFRRLKEIKGIEGIEVDAYIIQKRYSWLFLLLKRIKVTDGEFFIKEGVSIKNLWVRQSLIELLGVKYLKLSPLNGKNQLSKYIKIFQNYDILSTNDTLSSSLADMVKDAYGTPFVITWHGSDINIYPFENRKLFDLTKYLMEKANYNLFVSKKLLSVSERITINCNKDYYYIGPSKDFFIKSEDEVKNLKSKYGCNSQHVVGFVGNMLPVKNVMILPDIFKYIEQNFNSVNFVVVGSGRLLKGLKRKMIDYGIQDVIYLGNVSPENMPEIMNTFDLLILPSKNEGLPLVCVEALKCGVDVVGSDVGGISEVVGNENVVPLDENFIKMFAKRAIEVLIQPKNELGVLSDEFDLNVAIKKEINIYFRVLKMIKK